MISALRPETESNRCCTYSTWMDGVVDIKEMTILSYSSANLVWWMTHRFVKLMCLYIVSYFLNGHPMSPNSFKNCIMQSHLLSLSKSDCVILNISPISSRTPSAPSGFRYTTAPAAAPTAYRRLPLRTWTRHKVCRKTKHYSVLKRRTPPRLLQPAPPEMRFAARVSCALPSKLPPLTTQEPDIGPLGSVCAPLE
jgi:hypothetical protein